MLWPKFLGWHSCFTIWPKPAFANFSTPAACSLPQFSRLAPTLFSTESCSPSRGRLPVWLALLDPSYQSCVPMLPVSQGTAPALFSLESYLVPCSWKKFPLFWTPQTVARLSCRSSPTQTITFGQSFYKTVVSLREGAPSTVPSMWQSV